MSLPQVRLVDIHGREITPADQGDAVTWPAWTDNHYWEVADDERAALEAAEVERLTDLHDAPPDPWPTAEEMAEYDAEEEHRAAREWFDRRESFGDWLAREGGPRP
jgi:hypothetical protein